MLCLKACCVTLRRWKFFVKNAIQRKLKNNKINKDFFLTCDFHWIILLIKGNGKTQTKNGKMSVDLNFKKFWYAGRFVYRSSDLEVLKTDDGWKFKLIGGVFSEELEAFCSAISILCWGTMRGVKFALGVMAEENKYFVVANDNEGNEAYECCAFNNHKFETANQDWIK